MAGRVNRICTDIRYVNASDKTILTLVLSIDVTFPHGQRESHRTEYECFFAPDVIAPGDAESLTRDIDVTATMLQVDPEAQAEPVAEVQVLYVQFLDGASFGSEQHGMSILRIRKRTLDILEKLEEIYREKGEAKFLKALGKEVEEPTVETLLSNVRLTAEKDGAFWPAGKIRRMLQLAQEHQDSLGGSGGEKPGK